MIHHHSTATRTKLYNRVLNYALLILNAIGVYLIVS